MPKRKLLIDVINEAKHVNLVYVSGYTKSHAKCVYKCENHGIISMTPHAITRGSGCNKCGIEKTTLKLLKSHDSFVDDAIQVGLRYITYLFNNTVDDRHIYWCDIHGHVLKIPKFVKLGQGCPLCANDRISIVQCKSVESLHHDAIKVGLKYIGCDHRVPKNTVKHEYECLHHGRIWLTPAHVRSRGGCVECSKINSFSSTKKDCDELIEEAKLVGLRYCGIIKDFSVKSNHLYYCKTHGFIEMTPNNVKWGKTCSKCSITGFSPNKPGSLYCVNVTGQFNFIGYGISNCLQDRLNRHKYNIEQAMSKMETMYIFEFKDGEYAFKLEQFLKKQLRKFLPKDIVIGGFVTESVTSDKKDILLTKIGEWFIMNGLISEEINE